MATSLVNRECAYHMDVRLGFLFRKFKTVNIGSLANFQLYGSGNSFCTCTSQKCYWLVSEVHKLAAIDIDLLLRAQLYVDSTANFVHDLVRGTTCKCPVHPVSAQARVNYREGNTAWYTPLDSVLWCFSQRHKGRCSGQSTFLGAYRLGYISNQTTQS